MTTTIHHPSCPQRPAREQGENWGDRFAATRPACLCGPEAAAEDALILSERTPDTMLLDIITHANGAHADWLDNTHRRGGRRGLLAAVLLDNEMGTDEPMARSWGAK